MAPQDSVNDALLEFKEGLKAFVKKDLAPKEQEDMDLLVEAFYRQEIRNRGDEDLLRDFPDMEAAVHRFQVFLRDQGRKVL
jgi:hypothetical protein